MTETLATHCTPIEDAKLGFCGRILPHIEAKIVDVETGEALPPGKKGELFIRGPTVSSMRGPALGTVFLAR